MQPGREGDHVLLVAEADRRHQSAKGEAAAVDRGIEGLAVGNEHVLVRLAVEGDFVHADVVAFVPVRHIARRRVHVGNGAGLGVDVAAVQAQREVLPLLFEIDAVGRIGSDEPEVVKGVRGQVGLIAGRLLIVVICAAGLLHLSAVERELAQGEADRRGTLIRIVKGAAGINTRTACRGKENERARERPSENSVTHVFYSFRGGQYTPSLHP